MQYVTNHALSERQTLRSLSPAFLLSSKRFLGLGIVTLSLEQIHNESTMRRFYIRKLLDWFQIHLVLGCALANSIVHWQILLCTDKFCCELANSVVNWQILLWTGKFCCELANSVVHWQILLWTGKFCCALTNSVVNWQILLCTDKFCCEMANSVVHWQILLWNGKFYCALTNSVVNWQILLWLINSVVHWQIMFQFCQFIITFNLSEAQAEPPLCLCVWNDWFNEELRRGVLSELI